MVSPNAIALRERVLAAPIVRPPQPWRLVAEVAIGGLTEVGFALDSRHLLVLSFQGRGVFDCTSGDRVGRDRSEDRADWYVGSHLFANCLPPMAGQPVPVAGMWGGGLSTWTQDGWGLWRLQIPWPEEHILLTLPGHSLDAIEPRFSKICMDQESLAFGFSPDGKVLVVALRHTLTIYSRV
jgi:hypothetical protein